MLCERIVKAASVRLQIARGRRSVGDVHQHQVLQHISHVPEVVFIVSRQSSYDHPHRDTVSVKVAAEDEGVVN